MSIIAVNDVNDNLFDSTNIQQLENYDIKQIILFYEPIKLGYLKIIRDRGDTNNYILTLYTKEYVINVDKDVYIRQKKLDIIEESIKSEYFILNLKNIEFINGTVQLKTKFGAINTIIPVTDINTFEYYIDALDICDNKLNKTITDCEKQNNFCEREMKLYRDLKKTCKTQINGSKIQENEELKIQIDSNNQENQDLKQQLESKNEEIKELKKKINSNNQDNKDSNNSQSTQTTIIIICVFIIILLVSLCIYLYFFKR